jgi:hypothetical protein
VLEWMCSVEFDFDHLWLRKGLLYYEEICQCGLGLVVERLHRLQLERVQSQVSRSAAGLIGRSLNLFATSFLLAERLQQEKLNTFFRSIRCV